MSLEQAVQENTAAVRALIAALAGSTIASAANENVAQPDAAKPTKPKAVKTEAAPAPAPVDIAKDAYTPPTPDYDKEVAPLLTKVLKAGGRQTLMSLFGRFKVANGGQLKAEQYAQVIADCGATLEALEITAANAAQAA